MSTATSAAGADLGGASRRVLLLTVGGTISMVDHGSGAVPTLDAQGLAAGVGAGPAIALDAETYLTIPGAHLTLEQIVSLADRIDQAAAFDGIVVSQGTDTIEEVAFALQLLTQPGPAVVVTGAMRPASDPGFDGHANLADAVAVAASPLAPELGTVVVFSAEIHAAAFVRKAHTTATAAFASATGPIGWVAEGEPVLAMRPWSVPRLPRHLIPEPSTPVPEVPVVTVGLGTTDADAKALVARRPAGAVVDATGGGHVPAGLADPLGELAEVAPVVLCARPGAGPVLRRTYGFPGSERDLLARGLVSAGLLDARKARVALALLCASGASRDDIAAFFGEHA